MSISLPRERLIHALLERQAEKFGDRTFLYCKDEEFSYLDTNHRANRVACGFQSLGIETGDKVAIMMDNSPEYIFLMYGLPKIGAVQVPFNTAHKGNILTHMLTLSNTRAIVVGSRYLDHVERVLAGTPKLQMVVILDDGSQGKAVLDRTRVEITRQGRRVVDLPELCYNDGSYRPAEVLWSDPFSIMFTSGTTGASKGILTPHNSPLRQTDMMCEAGEYTENDRFYNALPLFHSSGMHMATTTALRAGAQMGLMERFSPSRFWEDVKRYGCTQFTFVASMLPMLLNAEPRPDDADNPLRMALGLGARKAICETFEKRFGVVIIDTYGQTECGLPLNGSIRNRKPGSCGKAHAHFAVKVVDDNGMEVGPNPPGELLLRPLLPYLVMLEYYNMPDKTVEAWRDLWLHTGDYLSYDEEGYFFFADRKKDALRRRGENVSSFEVEIGVNSHPVVLESAAVAARSDLGEDEVMVCVVLKPGQTLDPLDLIKHCEDRMAYFMVPRYVRFLEALPKTVTARVEKYLLREEGITADTWDREKSGYKLKR